MLFDWIELLLSVAIGLHVPKAFTLLYGLIACMAWRSFSDSRARGCSLWGHWLRWWPSLLAVVLFSVAYVSGMLAWGLWSWQADRADLVNALMLPVLFLWCGLQAVRWGRSWLIRILLAYSLGSLVYVLIALGVSRSPWWDVAQLFPSDDLDLPWGYPRVINARSVEQNAIPALSLLPAALHEWQRAKSGRHQWFAVAAFVSAMLGGYALWSLQGRLGWMVLVLASIPVLGDALRVHAVWKIRPKKLLLAVLVSLSILLMLMRPWRIQSGAVGWSQGFCDERLSLHAAILRDGSASPWGGRLLVAKYQLCDGSPAVLAPSGGTVSMAHNVVLDIFLDAGLAPVVFLAAALLPLLVRIVSKFWLAWSHGGWDWRVSVCWAWFALVICEWTFQPLLYSDGLLYYFSYFIVAALATGGFRSPGDSARMGLRLVVV